MMPLDIRDRVHANMRPWNQQEADDHGRNGRREGRKEGRPKGARTQMSNEHGRVRKAN